MPIEQLAKVIVEQASKSEMQKTMFEDSNRTSGMELPCWDEGEVVEMPKGKFYPDSDRDILEGPRWDEAILDDPSSEDLKFDPPVAYETDNPNGSTGASDNREKNNELNESNDSNENKNDSGEQKGLTDEQKQEIKEKTGWSDEIIDAIGSMEEAEIYMDAGLQEVEIDGKKCLIRDDIDMDQTDEDGFSNRERMERGRPPITKDGQEVELHHIGQKPDSPLAELTTQEHRGVGNDTILHDKSKESEIDRNEFSKERKSHWKSRVEEGGA